MRGGTGRRCHRRLGTVPQCRLSAGSCAAPTIGAPQRRSRAARSGSTAVGGAAVQLPGQVVCILHTCRAVEMLCRVAETTVPSNRSTRCSSGSCVSCSPRLPTISWDRRYRSGPKAQQRASCTVALSGCWGAFLRGTRIERKPPRQGENRARSPAAFGSMSAPSLSPRYSPPRGRTVFPRRGRGVAISAEIGRIWRSRLLGTGFVLGVRVGMVGALLPMMMFVGCGGGWVSWRRGCSRTRNWNVCEGFPRSVVRSCFGTSL